jgi:CHASE2 domain-containing sensor protein
VSQPYSSSGAASARNSETKVQNFWQRLMLLPQPAMRAAVLVTAAVVSALVLILFGGASRSIEERVGALGWTLFPDAAIEERITLVVIDEPSIAEIGPWPWSRSEMARLVSAISNAGAQLQLHDISYPEPKAGDEEFLTSLQASNGAVIAQTPVLAKQFTGSSAGQMTHPLTGISCSVGRGGAKSLLN